MKPNPVLLRLAAYLSGVILIACLLSPPLYWAGSALAEKGILPFLQGFPFHRYFSRSVQISALLMLWPAFQWIGIRRLGELGIERNTLWRRDLLLGFGIAFLPVIALSAGYLVFDVYDFKKSIPVAGGLRILGTASVVAILEEFLFRGVLLGLCLRSMRPAAAVLLSASIFAIVHFLKVAKSASEPAVTWLSGFAQLPQAFSSAPPWPLLGWGLLALLIAGILLAIVTLRTRSLFLAIGIHAGWILGQQGLQWAAKFRIKPPDALLPWAGPNVVSGAVPTGLIPAGILLLTMALAFAYLRNARFPVRSA
ncbi:MAG: CPBP family intramembrane glutamic endopeptidase [Terrimicrobiaceae bacterium]